MKSLERFRSDAVEIIEETKGAGLGSLDHEHAVTILRLCKALEKCRKQRNDYIEQNMLPMDVIALEIMDDEKLEAILRGES